MALGILFLMKTFGCDALVDDPEERRREFKYGWDPDEIWLPLEGFRCWYCQDINYYGDELVQFSKRRGAIKCYLCHVWNQLFDPDEFREQEDLKMIEDIDLF